ncbi:MAG: hypothetical protein D3910_04850 [Candidatus Electrothrix sp. ATG2]|nr:hypothetical protein [Candidatus Electrothrix sp. ATG2]
MISVLGSGQTEISLDDAARESRKAFCQIHNSHPRVLKLCAEDLGKSGSDGKDRFSPNAKYGGRLNLLCSEFASWYYSYCGIKIDGHSLTHIEGTNQMHEIFKDAGKLYYYHNGLERVFKHGSTSEEYVPRPGDYLERRGPDGAEHSMIILRWLPGNPSASHEEDKNTRAWVFNGPWPVGIREVRVHEREIEKDKDYYIGRM